MPNEMTPTQLRAKQIETAIARDDAARHEGDDRGRDDRVMDALNRLHARMDDFEAELKRRKGEDEDEGEDPQDVDRLDARRHRKDRRRDAEPARGAGLDGRRDDEAGGGFPPHEAEPARAAAIDERSYHRNDSRLNYSDPELRKRVEQGFTRTELWNDELCRHFGERGGPPLEYESLRDFQNRTLKRWLKYSPKWANADVARMDGLTLDNVAVDVRADTISKARTSSEVPAGILREVHDRDESGREHIRFYGAFEDVFGAWMTPMRGARVRRPVDGLR
jgi:hypothetical protein